MIREAEEHAGEDRERREVIEKRNALDSMVYQAGKTLNDNADKISAEDKQKVEAALSEARSSLESDDVSTARTRIEQAMHSMAEALYRGAVGRRSGRAGCARLRAGTPSAAATTWSIPVHESAQLKRLLWRRTRDRAESETGRTGRTTIRRVRRSPARRSRNRRRRVRDPEAVIVRAGWREFGADLRVTRVSAADPRTARAARRGTPARWRSRPDRSSAACACRPSGSRPRHRASRRWTAHGDAGPPQAGAAQRARRARVKS